MSEFELVGKVTDFEEGQGRAVPVDGRMVAVFRKGDEWYAIDDLCPHMGASLAAGFFEPADCTVTCPWHAWRFDTRDGTWCDNRRLKVDADATVYRRFRLQNDGLLTGIFFGSDEASVAWWRVDKIIGNER